MSRSPQQVNRINLGQLPICWSTLGPHWEEIVQAAAAHQQKLSVTLPDLHGNAILLVNRLVAAGVFQLSDARIYERLFVLYLEHQQHINAIPRNHAVLTRIKNLENLIRITEQSKATLEAKLAANPSGNFQGELTAANEKIAKLEHLRSELRLSIAGTALLENIREFKELINNIAVNTNVAIRLIGDILADRGHQDLFTLHILNHLRNNSVDYEIIFSNHDAIFQNALNTPGFDKAGLSNYQSNSFDNLKRLVSLGIITENEVRELADHAYKPNLKLISYEKNSNNQIVFYTHAPVDFWVIENLANHFEVAYRDDTPEAFCESVDRINAKFSELASNKSLSTQHEMEMQYSVKSFQRSVNDRFVSKRTWLTNFTWGRINTVSTNQPDTRDDIRTTFHWPNTGDWKAQAINVHGHVGPEGSIQSDRYVNIDLTATGKGTILLPNFRGVGVGHSVNVPDAINNWQIGNYHEFVGNVPVSQFHSLQNQQPALTQQPVAAASVAGGGAVASSSTRDHAAVTGSFQSLSVTDSGAVSASSQQLPSQTSAFSTQEQRTLNNLLTRIKNKIEKLQEKLLSAGGDTASDDSAPKQPLTALQQKIKVLEEAKELLNYNNRNYTYNNFSMAITDNQGYKEHRSTSTGFFSRLFEPQKTDTEKLIEEIIEFAITHPKTKKPRTPTSEI